MFLISDAYAQAAAPAGAAAGPMGSIMSFLPLVAMFAVLYFIMVRPQKKQNKERRSMIDALAPGDEVATQGGLMGRVTKVRDDQVDLLLAQNVTVHVKKNEVVQLLPKGTLSL